VVSPGVSILRLIKVDKVIARFKVPERHIGRLKDRMIKGPVDVAARVDAYPGRVFPGRIVRVAPGLETASRTVAVEAEVKNPDGRLMPGMYSRVEISLGTRMDALRLPLTAVIDRVVGPAMGRNPALKDGPRSDGHARVFVIKKGRARTVRVVLGVRDGRYAEVLRGLAEGVRVITDGKERLRDGRPVRVTGAGANGPGRAARRKTETTDGRVKKQRGAL
jgi:membrane fusion protein (multidrug efflux system)